ncbi:MAG: hypothetical protein R3E67_06500 [Pseudomonadales bacterium]
MWRARLANKNGFRGVCCWVCLAYDSALTLAIADAPGAERVAVKMMLQSTTRLPSAWKMLKRKQKYLKWKYSVIPDETAVNAFTDMLTDSFSSLPTNAHDTTEQKSASALSRCDLDGAIQSPRQFGVDYGHKSEVAVGYCTPVRRYGGGFDVLCYAENAREGAVPLLAIASRLLFRIA